MKKLLFLLIILALAGGGVYYYYNYGKPKEKPTVQVANVSQGPGTVNDLFGVDFNSIVKKGQKIAHLDDSLLQVQVQIQIANIDRQKGDIDNQKVQLED